MAITDVTTVDVSLVLNGTVVSTVSFTGSDPSGTEKRDHLGLAKFHASSDQLQMKVSDGTVATLSPIDPNAQSGNLLKFVVVRSLNGADGVTPGVVGKVVAI